MSGRSFCILFFRFLRCCFQSQFFKLLLAYSARCNPTLLVDTYNTLKSGVPNAIKVFKEVLIPQGKTKCAIRLDSGDISYLSKKARKMLDDAGLTECTITASNALDEYLIRDLMMQGAQVDTFGVGERSSLHQARLYSAVFIISQLKLGRKVSGDSPPAVILPFLQLKLGRKVSGDSPQKALHRRFVLPCRAFVFSVGFMPANSFVKALRINWFPTRE